MSFQEIKTSEIEEFNSFVESHPLGSIHQIYQWGKFQEKDQHRGKFWAIIKRNEAQKIEASALIFKQKLPFGLCWLYCPRGPLMDYNTASEIESFYKYVKALAKKEKAVFLRIDPGYSDTETQTIVPSLKKAALKQHLTLKRAHSHYQPENTLIIDLNQSEENILNQMKPKGRYNIKVAQKNGVKIEKYTADNTNELPSAVKEFHQLLITTTERDGFGGHDSNYYLEMLKNLGARNATLYLADYQGKKIAGLLATHFNNTAIYYFGASSNENRNVMAPYLLQWQAITDAKKTGYHFYDFLGIAPEGAKNHPWAGVTEFKLKFGGARLDYLKAQELVFKPFWYSTILMRKKIAPLLKLLKKAGA